MKRLLRLVAVALAPFLLAGCTSTGLVLDAPPLSSPIQFGASTNDNPVYVPLSVTDYGPVFEAILQTVGDYGFEFADSTNRFDGRIETLPRVSPGLWLLLKPGSPNLYERLLATTQTYRNRVTVLIQPADHGGFHGGYHVEFIVRKELEDSPRPIRSTVGGAVWRTEPTVERSTEVLDATYFEANWINRGRDPAMEQELIRRFKTALDSSRRGP